MDTDKLLNDPAKSVPYKVQIFAQAVVQERRNSPVQEMQKTEFGVEIPVLNWYREHQCEQMACNFNALYLAEKDFEKYWSELGKAIKHTMAKRGLLK